MTNRLKVYWYRLHRNNSYKLCNSESLLTWNNKKGNWLRFWSGSVVCRIFLWQYRSKAEKWWSMFSRFLKTTTKKSFHMPLKRKKKSELILLFFSKTSFPWGQWINTTNKLHWDFFYSAFWTSVKGIRPLSYFRNYVLVKPVCCIFLITM